MAMIDYGAVLFKDGIKQNDSMFMDMNSSVGWSEEPIKGNYFVYAGDQHLTVCAYKTWARVLLNTSYELSAYGCNLMKFIDNDDYYEDDIRCRKTLHFNVDGVQFKVKAISHRVFWMSFRYKDSNYNIIYGYGIDPNFKIWDEIKVKYLGKKISRKVDAIYHRIQHQ